jgi:hypothetical protein
MSYLFYSMKQIHEMGKSSGQGNRKAIETAYGERALLLVGHTVRLNGEKKKGKEIQNE